MTEELDTLLADLDAAFKPGAATPAHADRLERFKRDLLAKEGRTGGERGVEIKEESCKHSGGHTYFLIEVGLVGDEGTLAGIFCRNRRHIVVGRRGGVKLLNAKGRGRRFARTQPAGWWNALHALTV